MKRPTILTAVFVEDKENGGFTAFFPHYPGVVGDGDNLIDATASLSKALKEMEKWDEDEDQYGQ